MGTIFNALYSNETFIFAIIVTFNSVWHRRVRRRVISVTLLRDVAASTLTTRQTTRQLLTTSTYLSAPSKTSLKVCYFRYVV